MLSCTRHATDGRRAPRASAHHRATWDYATPPQGFPTDTATTLHRRLAVGRAGAVACVRLSNKIEEPPPPDIERSRLDSSTGRHVRQEDDLCAAHQVLVGHIANAGAQ